MPDPLAGYAYTADLAVTDDDLDVQRHLNNVAIVRLFQELRVGYVQTHMAPGRLVLFDEVVVVTADVHVSYLSQGMPGEAFRGGARVLARTEKAYCYDEVVVAAADRRVIARARVVELWLSRETGRVIALPEGFVEMLERAEGRSVLVDELPVPRIDWSPAR